MKSGPRTLAAALFALITVGAVGCDLRPEDFGQVQAAAKKFSDDGARRVADVRARQDELFARAQALPPDLGGLAEIVSRLNAAKAQLDALASQVATVRDEAEAQIQARHQRQAYAAMSRGRDSIQRELDGIAGDLDALAGGLDNLEKQQRAAIAAARNATSTSVAEPAFARGNNNAIVRGIEFEPGSGNLDLRVATTQPALDQLVVFANACPELRFNVLVHTAKDGKLEVNQKVAEARAVMIKRYLAAKGIPEERVTSTLGFGGDHPLVDEPEPGSPEEAAMDTARLAAIRAQNRRVEITVAVPCP